MPELRGEQLSKWFERVTWAGRGPRWAMSSQNLIHLLALLACRWLGGRAVAQAGVQSGLSRTAVLPSAVTGLELSLLGLTVELT